MDEFFYKYILPMVFAKDPSFFHMQISLRRHWKTYGAKNMYQQNSIVYFTNYELLLLWRTTNYTINDLLTMQRTNSRRFFFTSQEAIPHICSQNTKSLGYRQTKDFSCHICIVIAIYSTAYFVLLLLPAALLSTDFSKVIFYMNICSNWKKGTCWTSMYSVIYCSLRILRASP